MARLRKPDRALIRHSLTSPARQADDLRTWLNAKAMNLHEPTDLDTKG